MANLHYQLRIKPNSCVSTTPPPTQHHSFFRNYPVCRFKSFKATHWCWCVNYENWDSAFDALWKTSIQKTSCQLFFVLYHLIFVYVHMAGMNTLMSSPSRPAFPTSLSGMPLSPTAAGQGSFVLPPTSPLFGNSSGFPIPESPKWNFLLACVILWFV